MNNTRHIATLPRETQEEIKTILIRRGTEPEDMEAALNSSLCDLEEIERDITERDTRDMNREIAPLKQADDAVFLDSSDMTIDEVVEKIKSLCK